MRYTFQSLEDRAQAKLRLGRLLALEQSRRGLKRYELAEQAGIKEFHISRLKAGSADSISIESLIAAVSRMGLDPWPVMSDYAAPRMEAAE